jgi:hypothetical protein
MSLTSFVETKKVRERFAQEFQKPRLLGNREMLAPPLTKNYSMVGTAFDYLLRFYLKRLNPGARTQDWIAEIGVKYLEGEGKLYAVACDKMRQAKCDYAVYLKKGEFSEELICSAIFLAKMDSVYRVSMFHPVFRVGPEGVKFRKKFLQADNQDVADLRQLVSLLPSNTFRAKRVCILNPTFGKASMLVGGADADFVIDDMLVEVKTTKQHELQRKHFNQLIGYYCLHQIGRIRGAPKDHKILRFGVYYSRFRYLWTLDVGDVIDKKKFPPFLKGFRRELVTR